MSARIHLLPVLVALSFSAPAGCSSSDDNGATPGDVTGQGGGSAGGHAGGSTSLGGASGHAGTGAGGLAHAGASGVGGAAHAGAGGLASAGKGGASQQTGGGGQSSAGASGQPGAGMGGQPVGAGGQSSAGAAGTGGTDAQGGTGGTPTGRLYPDTTSMIGILADQLPGGMTAAQQQFAATHYVGTQKLTLSQSAPLRAINPGFLVLHYHLGIWQSAPGVDFIVDGQTWGNDFPGVDMHESWFWHSEAGQRIASTADQKLLMNLNDPDFRAYWASSIAMQVKLGDYDGVFADSSSPALLQGEVGGQDPRLSGTGARDTPIAEWGGKTYIEVWNGFMAELDATLAASGIPLIPNQSAFTTTWDTSKYDQTGGVFSEGFASPDFSETDWKASTTELLTLSPSKILILQSYLSGPDDLAHRRYYLANYLLVRGGRTYLDYFDDKGPLEWFPEWEIDTGKPSLTATKADDLLTADGIYRRDFDKAVALVNPTDADVMVSLGASMLRLEPQGGGLVDPSGIPSGTLSTTAVTQILVPAHGAEVLLK